MSWSQEEVPEQRWSQSKQAWRLASESCGRKGAKPSLPGLQNMHGARRSLISHSYAVNRIIPGTLAHLRTSNSSAAASQPLDEETWQEVHLGSHTLPCHPSISFKCNQVPA